MKKLFTLLLFLVLLVPGALAAGNVKLDNNIDIDSNYWSNIYLFGDHISVPANVSGDIIAAGSVINLTGVISDDASIMGSNVLLDGVVGGDARIVASVAEIDSAVFGDLVVLGADITLGKDTLVGKDLYLMGQDIESSGRVIGNAYIKGRTVYVDSEIEGNAVIKASSIEWGEDAVISGNLVISDNLEVPLNVVSGKIEKVPYDSSSGSIHFSFWDSVIFGIMILIVGLLFSVFFKGYKNGVFVTYSQRPWLSLILGVAALIAVPIISTVLLITVVGVPLGIILWLLYGLLIILAVPVCAMYLGSLLFRILRFEQNTVYSFVAGIFLFLLIPLIPIVGPIVVAIAYIMGTGAIIRNIFGKDKPKRLSKRKSKPKKAVKSRKSSKKKTHKLDV